MAEESAATSGGTTQPVQALTGKRSNWTIAHKVEGNTIVFTVKGAGELKLNMTDVHEANRVRAMGHGFVQRVSDAAAIARDTKTGKSATPEEKLAAMKRLVDHYESGAEGWSPIRAEGGEREPSGAADLRTALGELYPQKAVERIAEFVKGLTGAERLSLMASDAVKPLVDRMRDQRAKVQAAGVDAQKLLESI